ncbi:LOW QUALITY PROTEIN: uncharacterized protein LOC17898360 [Capsella rubella]|uniref:LOW QUALITY PROTEIN: uncharacterized protein LOC17898360 n=1 Tax=Capsella rubella TaxID=81985 RepID=UPI000CD57BC6|nr:LOW QUALITY PROTEIN: uncharacterized protein LOC17898360 [Capsella rubella]
MALREMIIDESDDIESYSDQSLCLDKAKELLALINLPTGLLPLKDMTEVGYNKTKGFVWMRMKSKIEHTFPEIGRRVLYDTEITAFVEDRRMKRLTGVKSKELMIWVPVNDIFIRRKILRRSPLLIPPAYHEHLKFQHFNVKVDKSEEKRSNQTSSM